MQFECGAEQSVVEAHLDALRPKLAEACQKLGELCERHAQVAQAWKGRVIVAPANVNPTPNGSGCVAVGFDSVPGAASYVVRWNRVLADGSPGDPYGGVLVVDGAPALVTGLVDDTMYTFSCAAIADDAGEGPSSLPVGCMPTATLPEAPLGLTVSTSASRIAMVSPYPWHAIGPLNARVSPPPLCGTGAVQGAPKARPRRDRHP